MKAAAVLLKKQFREMLPVKKKGEKKPDLAGMLFTLVLLATGITLIVLCLKLFSQTYLNIRINRVLDTDARLYEMFTVLYAVILIVCAISGAKIINNQLFYNDDTAVFLYLPISSAVLYSVRMITAYIKQLFVSFVCVLPVNLTLGMLTNAGAAFYGSTVLILFLLPFFSLGLGSFIALPIYLFKRVVSSRYAMALLLMTAAAGLVFWAYSGVLEFIKDLISSGNVKYFFNAEVMSKISAATAKMYPAVFFAKILTGSKIGSSTGIIIGISVVFVSLGILISRYALIPASQNKFADQNRHIYKAPPRGGAHSAVGALLKKELLLVLRTPDYAFQYFSTAIIMPLMLYFCMNIFSELVGRMLPIDCNMELALFLIVMFGALTNTFCATNISRDGEMFLMLKTLPIEGRKIIKAKLIFCSIVSAAALTGSVVLLAALKFVDMYEALFIFAVGAAVFFAQICFGTGKDIRHPHFSSDLGGEIKESNTTVSSLIVLSMLVSFLIGLIALTSGLVLKLRGDTAGEWITMAAVGGIALMTVVLGCVYLFHDLDARLNKIGDDGV